MVTIKWNSQYKKYYEEKGYKYTKMNDEFNISVSDLTPGSNIKVQCICDYCRDKFERVFKRLNTSKDNFKLCCNKCHYKKHQETIIKKYDVDNISKSTIINNNKSFKLKSKIEDTILKIKQNNIKKYGVDNLFKSKEFIKSIQERGYKFGFQRKEIQEKIHINGLKTMYKNGTGTCSKQQKYLCDLLNGELNYPVDKCMLDITFPDEKIYIEYDGSGHDLRVKYGMSREEFNKQEKNRKIFLQNKGWKIIRIISSKDLLPNDTIILDLINNCKNYLNQNHSWIEINIDKSQIKCSEYCENINLKKLRKIES